MAWNLEDGRPIYTQLVERIQMQIVSGQYAPGDKLPSVRELAAVASVNPNTMQRAFAELEGSGLVITQRTNGRIVTQDRQLIEDIRQKLANDMAEDFFAKMNQLGYERDAAFEILKSHKERNSIQWTTV
jgi:DNA-binding transcriptional regulator YhcF (GntR family)